MVILENPYVSDSLLAYLEESQLPVLKNKFVENRVSENNSLNLVEENQFIEEYQKRKKVYTVSEYALGWVNASLNDAELKRQVTLLKDKTAFREASAYLYPDFFFYELSYEELLAYDVSNLQLPVILKPSIGFLSKGVYTILNEEDWKEALIDIKKDIEEGTNPFPTSVVRNDVFIVESYIKGKEFAVDIYFNDKKPVIVNIFEHPFSSAKDVSDRLYVTSKAIFDQYLTPFTEFMTRLNEALQLDHIPIHIELRVDGDNIMPIEINPLRFTGMCLNEINFHITGKHPLHYFFTNSTPDYSAMWKDKENDSYCFSILEKPNASEKDSLDLDSALKTYSNILELRRVNNPKLAIQAFVFSKTNQEEELQEILNLKMQ